MLTETMERRPEIGFASYDRFFPSQDTMPVGGFGNLIALPLQRRARELGNSVFADKDLRPFAAGADGAAHTPGGFPKPRVLSGAVHAFPDLR